MVEDGQISVGEPWSLLGEGDDGWRPGGTQPATFDAGLDLLVTLMHQGGADTQDDAGPEAWLHHRATQRRIGRIKFDEPASAVLVVEGDEPLLLAAVGAGVGVYDLRTGRRLRTVEGAGGGALLRY